MGIVICNLQLASRSPSTESETGCEEKIDEAGEAFVEHHITQQKIAGYLGKSLKIEDGFFLENHVISSKYQISWFFFFDEENWCRKIELWYWFNLIHQVVRLEC